MNALTALLILCLTLFLAGCSGLPKNAPVEFAQARDEIAQAEDEDVDDVFGVTLQRAEDTLDQAKGLYREAQDYKDPKSISEKQSEAVAQAVRAKTLASNAREAYRRVHSWDSDMELFAQSKNLSARLSGLESELRSTTSALKTHETRSSAPVTNTVAFFEMGKSELTPDNRERVNEIANVLKNNPNLAAQVMGYTDSTGSPEINQKLAEERARAVAQELSDNGVNERQIQIRSVGVRSTSADTKDKGKLQLDRRVEIRLSPLRTTAD